MSILSWIVIGGLAGWVASIIMGTNARQGLLGNILVGIVGALVGGFVMQQLGNYKAGEFKLETFLVATGGACLVLFILRLLRR